jgi:hypothetical protein
MDDQIKTLLTTIISLVQLIVVIVGAIWAYFRFRRENPLHPRIEFDLDCKFFTPQDNSYLTAITVSASNKGNVEHKFSEIRLRILGIKNNQPLEEFAKYPPMVEFPVEIMKGVNIVPPKYEYFFVRPNVNQTFNYATQIPSDTRFIIIRATFKYQ